MAKKVDHDKLVSACNKLPELTRKRENATDLEEVKNLDKQIAKLTKEIKDLNGK